MPQHRICFISLSAYHYFLDDEPTGGGIQRQFHFLSTHLTGSFDVEFVVGDYGQSRRVSHEEVTLHRAYSPDPTSSVGQRGRQLITLYRALRQADADVYILSSPRKLPVVKLLLYSLRKPLVFHVASDAVVEIPPSGFTGIRRRLYDWALRESATVVAQTPYQATQIRNHWDVAATVIPNGYPPATVVDMHESREYFLWVGRLTETVKRPHLFLDVAEAIPDELMARVEAAHRDGWGVDGDGYHSPWSEAFAREVALRGHTTSLSMRYLSGVAGADLEPPQRYFSVEKVYRNDTLDPTHLLEFFQIEGWVMAEDLSVRDLMGTFEEFYRQFGITDISFKPHYNPYTEPSFELFGEHPETGEQIEIGNSGVFREEVTGPLGVDCDVMAWGLALERLAMLTTGAEDIRDLHGTLADIDFLRNAEVSH